MASPKKGVLTSDTLVPSVSKGPSKEDIAKSAFQNGNFGDAIRHLKVGGKVKRNVWPGQVYLSLAKEELLKHSPTWAAGFQYDAIHADLLAKDWQST